MVIAQRRSRVSELYLSGWTQKRIAAEVGVSEFTVSEDIHALLAQWGRTAGINISAHIATEFEKLNNLEAQAWAAYEDSKRPRKVASASKRMLPIRDDDGTVAMLESTTASATEFHPAAGDPRWLSIILQCISQRMKLFGLANRGGGEVEEKEKYPTTFAGWMALELSGREDKIGGTSTQTASRPVAAPLDPARLP
ncbi:MAG: hypothetical protein PCFJNLEI_00680 [Verrucomicrobiae bacterium]|nr:hypothetical protein [Verrucomicrobiae bacterium]